MLQLQWETEYSVGISMFVEGLYGSWMCYRRWIQLQKETRNDKLSSLEIFVCGRVYSATAFTTGTPQQPWLPANIHDPLKQNQ